MNKFPRTNIEDLSVSRLMIGTNWFLGYSHTSEARDKDIRRTMTPERIADILVTFMNSGVDTLYGIIPEEKIVKAIDIAEQRTGRKLITICIPTLPDS